MSEQLSGRNTSKYIALHRNTTLGNWVARIHMDDHFAMHPRQKILFWKHSTSQHVDIEQQYLDTKSVSVSMSPQRKVCQESVAPCINGLVLLGQSFGNRGFYWFSRVFPQKNMRVSRRFCLHEILGSLFWGPPCINLSRRFRDSQTKPR